MTRSSARPAGSLILNEQDNVGVVLGVVKEGEVLGDGVVARQTIMRGHKGALRRIGAGEPVIKFGQIIGFASTDIAPGEWVHTHNVVMGDLAHDYAFGEGVTETPVLPVSEQATFNGYRRENGKAGTRNYIGVLTSVNCSATVAGL
ncbi:MAG TPA: altronate dehydratase, partial [Devosia sp.]|nr:altronate dehydratase [Devosia sp.]